MVCLFHHFHIPTKPLQDLNLIIADIDQQIQDKARPLLSINFDDKFGIAPSNTTLTITYRYNPTQATINFGTNALTSVDNPIFGFNKEENYGEGKPEN